MASVKLTLSSRLRVHTTSVNAGRDQGARFREIRAENSQSRTFVDKVELLTPERASNEKVKTVRNSSRQTGQDCLNQNTPEKGNAKIGPARVDFQTELGARGEARSGPAHVNDCFRMFNPVSPAGYEDVVSSWVAASFTLLRLLDSHPLIPTLHASSPQGVAAVTNTEDLQSGDPSRTGATPAEEPAVLSTERASIAVPETVTKALQSQIHRKTLDGYSSELTVITIEPGGRDTPREDKIRVLMNFAQHGREIITSEVALRLLEKLAKSPELVASEFTASQADAQKLESMLRNSVILVSPMENINGRRMVEGGKLCERKNGHGVDTNRNWAVDWGKKEKDYDPSEEYPGKEPLSEPESFMLHELLLSFQPHAWVNVHSGMEALFMPYDHQARIPETRGAQAMLSLLNAINTGHCKGRCVVGSGGKSVGYLAHGTATDYIYERLQVPVVFTWEIYGDQK
eukprot:gene8954-10608_t